MPFWMLVLHSVRICCQSIWFFIARPSKVLFTLQLDKESSKEEMDLGSQLKKKVVKFN